MPLIRRRPLGWDEATSDEELVGWAQRGQQEAFGVLYDRYLTRVYGYCARLLGEREAAEDANGTVFLRVLAALPDFRADAGSGAFRAWLFAIVHNVVAGEMRKRREIAPLEAAEYFPDPAPSPEDLAVAAANHQAIALLLPRLSEDQREVVALRLSGLSAAEIGEVLGRPRNAIDGIQHRAVVRLRELMAIGSEPAAAKGGGRG